MACSTFPAWVDELAEVLRLSTHLIEGTCASEGRVAAVKTRPAAVLVPIVARERPSILLTRRQLHLREHPGQISFPGGRFDESDEGDCVKAALRETFEEIGVVSGEVTVLGRLSNYVTRSNYDIVPIVGVIPANVALDLNFSEVSEVFEVPLSRIMAPLAERRHSYWIGGRLRYYWAFPIGPHYIWGTTAAILIMLSSLLRASNCLLE